MPNKKKSPEIPGTFFECISLRAERVRASTLDEALRAVLPVLNFGYTYLSGCNSCSCCNRWYLYWADDYTPKV
jgi:hypothetical protein